MQPHSPNPPSKFQENPPSGCLEKPFESLLQIIRKKKEEKKKEEEEFQGKQ